MNHVTDDRVRGLEDPGGLLTVGIIFRLATAQENYAVAVGYAFSSTQSLKWKSEIRARGMNVLRQCGWHFGSNPAALFEYDFIDKLAFELRDTTNAILGHAVSFHEI